MQEDSRDDRRAPRWQVDGLECKVYIGGQWWPASIVDVSLTGLHVKLDLPEKDRVASPDIVAVMLADLQVQTSGRIVIETDVVWWNAPRCVGGLCFKGLNEQSAQRYHALIVPHIAEGQSV